MTCGWLHYVRDNIILRVSERHFADGQSKREDIVIEGIERLKICCWEGVEG